MHKLRELWEFHKPVVLLVTCLVFIVAAVAAFYVTSHHSYSTTYHKRVVYGGPAAPATTPPPADPGIIKSYLNQDTAFWFNGDNSFTLLTGTTVHMICWWDNPNWNGPHNGEMFRVSVSGQTGYVAADAVSNQWAVPACPS